MPAVPELTPEDFPLSAFSAAPGAPSKATLLRAIHANELVAVKVGREYRVTPESYADWQRRRRVPASEVAPELPVGVQDSVERLVAAAPPLTQTQIRVVAGELVRRLTSRGAAA